ncbi:MAG TPA: nucleotide exchange factor GrpE [Thermoleophilia bacterium]|nr:nucleotide exchange factor GrpE [Thermoleophilia bacterium]
MTDKRNTRDDGKRKARAKTAEAAPPAGAAETEADAAVATAGQQDVSDELDKLATQCDEYLDHLRRLQAEFDNYRKRVQRDSEQHRLRAAEVVVESLLPVMDNMSRALEAAAQHEEGQLIAGLELVAGQLRGTLEGHGLEEVPVEAGTLFDPNIHEAVMTQASDDYEEGTVLQVLERGYLLHGRLLRPAKVIVTS